MGVDEGRAQAEVAQAEVAHVEWEGELLKARVDAVEADDRHMLSVWTTVVQKGAPYEEGYDTCACCALPTGVLALLSARSAALHWSRPDQVSDWLTRTTAVRRAIDSHASRRSSDTGLAPPQTDPH